jgi:hypothetical protein
MVYSHSTFTISKLLSLTAQTAISTTAIQLCWSPPNTITIVAWINSANVMGFSPAGYGQSIIGYSPAGSEYDYWIYLQDRNINVVVYNAVNIGIATTSSPIALSNTWYQIAVTATTGGQENAYVDGVNVLSATAGSVYWTGGNSIIGDLRAARE